MLARRVDVALLAVVVAACAGGESERGPQGVNPRVVERRVFQLVNQERRTAGLNDLQWDESLAAEARRHSFNMVARWFFAHDDPVRGGLGKRLKAGKIAWRQCAENIFNEQGYPKPAEMAVRSWLNSPGHRANIYSPRLTHTGVGAVARADGTLFITQDFIRP